MAMCSAMQDAMQDKPEDITEENEADTADNNQETNDAPTAENEAPDVEEKELDPMEALEIEAAKWKDQAIRTAAELDNYRKRMAREKQDAVRYGNQRLLEELLPVLDNFNMGMQAAAQEEGSMLYMGMNMVQTQISEFLTAQGADEIPAEAGVDFDPNIHEAISQEASEEIEEGKIIRVVRKGYRIGERLLRPSNVIVALGETAEEATDSENSPESE